MADPALPGVIRINDLATPRLDDVQRLALEYGERHPVQLTEDAVLDAARTRTGLTSFGPDDFRARMNLWLGDVAADTNRTALGRRMIFDYCVRYAANRQRIFDLLTRHPEIRATPIVAPVVVVGLPRSGTTHLLNLLSADTRLRSLPLWESYEPIAVPDEPVADDGVDPRYRRAAIEWEQMQMVAPYTAAMHPMDPDHIHEEIELQGADFAHYQPEWVSYAPRYRDWYLATDQTPHYEFLRTVLQILQWQDARGRDHVAGNDSTATTAPRWVLKSPQHLEQLGPLLHTFPDATIVTTHRDPVSVVQSAATMTAYAARLQYREVDPGHHLRYWADRIEILLRASVRDARLIDPDRHVDVYFDDFMTDEIDTMRRILGVAGLSWTETCAAQVGQRRTERPRGKYGRVAYDLRADFGADPAEIRDRFAFYFTAYPRLRVEVP